LACPVPACPEACRVHGQARGASEPPEAAPGAKAFPGESPWMRPEASELRASSPEPWTSPARAGLEAAAVREASADARRRAAWAHQASQGDGLPAPWLPAEAAWACSRAEAPWAPPAAASERTRRPAAASREEEEQALPSEEAAPPPAPCPWAPREAAACSAEAWAAPSSEAAARREDATSRPKRALAAVAKGPERAQADAPSLEEPVSEARAPLAPQSSTATVPPERPPSQAALWRHPPGPEPGRVSPPSPAARRRETPSAHPSPAPTWVGPRVAAPPRAASPSG